ncbi:MAG: alpha-glucosidase/alpha-galactosidase [Ruminococcaceae bacterium]|nr:alpha-glucosidase/alpha-galactosidase [Oscillospiraceae bacterium]
MKKIVIIGAGSFNFTRAIARDIFTFPALSDSRLVLVDIPEGEKYMTASKKIIEKTIAQGGYAATVEATFDRRAALVDADAVIITIRNDTTIPAWERDLVIPKKYGVDTVIGDTRGPSGIFRFLRSSVALKAIAEDILELCPNALVLNYTNPMCMVTDYMRRLGVEVYGLCHSVQNTLQELSKWIGADPKDVTFKCAGINHQAFFYEFKVNGVDAYPAIREAAEKPENYKKEAVRIEMMKGLGYFVTESSGHNSEYNAWFRKRQDLIDAYAPDSYASSVRIITDRDAKRDKQMEDVLAQETISLARGHEYAAYILNAVMGDGELFTFHGNVRNTGLITNLPDGVIVEVPVLASKEGLRPLYVGDLPRHIAALNTQNAQCEALAVDGLMACDREMIYHAIVNDPLTASVCSLAEIRRMTEELFEANRDDLPMFN